MPSSFAVLPKSSVGLISKRTVALQRYHAIICDIPSKNVTFSPLLPRRHRFLFYPFGVTIHSPLINFSVKFLKLRRNETLRTELEGGGWPSPTALSLALYVFPLTPDAANLAAEKAMIRSDYKACQQRAVFFSFRFQVKFLLLVWRSFYVVVCRPRTVSFFNVPLWVNLTNPFSCVKEGCFTDEVCTSLNMSSKTNGGGEL